jgi:hypothetical protein
LAPEPIPMKPKSSTTPTSRPTIFPALSWTIPGDVVFTDHPKVHMN